MFLDLKNKTQGQSSRNVQIKAFREDFLIINCWICLEWTLKQNDDSKLLNHNKRESNDLKSWIVLAENCCVQEILQL